MPRAAASAKELLSKSGRSDVAAEPSRNLSRKNRENSAFYGVLKGFNAIFNGLKRTVKGFTVTFNGSNGFFKGFGFFLKDFIAIVKAFNVTF